MSIFPPIRGAMPKRATAVLIALCLLGTSVPPPAHAQTQVCPPTIACRFQEDALTQGLMSFRRSLSPQLRIRQIQDAARLRVKRYAFRKSLQQARVPRQQERQARLQLERKSLSSAERRALDLIQDEVEFKSPEKLIRSYAPLMVQSVPALRGVQTRMADYERLRSHAAAAIRDGDIAHLSESAGHMSRALQDVKILLGDLPLRDTPRDATRAELEDAYYALQFLKISQASKTPISPMYRLAIQQIARGLEQAPRVAKAENVIDLIDFSHLDRIWPEGWAALRAEQTFAILDHRPDLRHLDRGQLFRHYLTSEAMRGHISSLTAQQWAARPPRLSSADAAELIAQLPDLQVAPEEPQTTLEPMDSRRHSDGRKTWKRPLAAAAAVVVVGLGLFFSSRFFPAHTPTNGASDVPSVTDARDRTPSVDLFGSDALAVGLARARDVTPAQQEQALELARERRALDREIARLEIETKAAEAVIQTRQGEIQKAKSELAELQKNVEAIKAAPPRPAETPAPDRERFAKAFEEHRDLTPGQRVSPRGAERAASGVGIFGATGSATRAGLSVGTETSDKPIARETGVEAPVLRFANPVTGFIRMQTFDRFDRAQGEWTRVKPTLSNTESYHPTTPSKAENTVSTTIHADLTSLPLPDGMAPLVNSFSFDGTAQFDVRQDAHGQFYLWIEHYRAPLQVTFSIGRYDDHRYRALSPIPRDTEAMEDSTRFQSDTRDLLTQVRQVSGRDAKKILLLQSVYDRFEYTIGDIDHFHRRIPGHYVAGVDQYQVPLDGALYRLAECQISETYYVALARDAGIPARYVTGYSAPPGTTVITTYMGHAVAELYNDENIWELVDATAPNRVNNGEEARFGATLPAVSPRAAEVQKAVRAAQAAVRRLAELETKTAADRRETERLQTKRSEVEQKRRAWNAKIPPEKRPDNKWMDTLTQEFGKSVLSLRLLAQQNPEAAARAVTDSLDRLRAAMNASGVPSDIQIRYRAGLLEEAEQALPPSYRHAIATLRADTYTEWLKNPGTRSPQVFVEFKHQMPINAPVTGVWKADGSFPWVPPPAKEYVNKHIPILTLPASIDPSIPLWLQNASGRILGFLAWNNSVSSALNLKLTLYDLLGHRVMLPDLSVGRYPRIKKLLDTPFGVPYGLFEGTDGKDHIINILTGDEFPIPARAATKIMDVAFDVRGEAFIQSIDGIYSSRSAERLFPLDGVRKLFSYRGHVYTYESLIESASQSDQLLDLSNGASVAIPWKKYGPAPGQSLLFTILDNPVTHELYWFNYAIYRHGLYHLDPEGTPISEAGLTNIRNISFDENGHGYYYADRESHSGNHWLYTFDNMYQASEVHQSDIALGRWHDRTYTLSETPVEHPDSLIEYRLIVSRNPEMPRPFTGTVMTTPGVSGPFEGTRPEGNRILSDGSVVLRTQEKGRGSVEMFIWNELDSQLLRRRLSDPDAEDVSEPLVVGGNIIFAERVNGVWRGRAAEDSPLGGTRVEHITHSGKVYFTTPHTHGSHALYVWEKGRAPQRVSALDGDVGPFFPTGEDLYFITTDDDHGKQLWKAGQAEPMSDPNVQVYAFSRAPDGALYYAGISNQTGSVSISRNGEFMPTMKTQGETVNPNSFVFFHTDAGETHVLWKSDSGRSHSVTQTNDIMQMAKTTEPLYTRGVVHPVVDPRGVSPFYWLSADDKGPLQLVDAQKNTVVAGLKVDNKPMNEKFGPDGAYYFLDNERLWKVDRQGQARYLQDYRVLIYSIEPDGRVFFQGVRAGDYGADTFGWLDAEMKAHIPHKMLNNNGYLSAEGLPTHIIWAQDAQGRRVPHFGTEQKTRKVLSRSVTLEGNDMLPAPLQTGPRGTAVLKVSSDNGESLLLLDPYLELERMLDNALSMATADPALLRAPEWRAWVDTLVARTRETESIEGARIPTARLVKLWALAALQGPERFRYGGALGPLRVWAETSPQTAAEARSRVAEVIQTIFTGYRERHGQLPFNPNILDDQNTRERLLNDGIQNRMRPLFGVLRPGDPDARALLEFNENLETLFREAPALRPKPEDLGDVWMARDLLQERWLRAFVMQGPGILLLGAWLAAALAGAYTRAQRRGIQRVFLQLLVGQATFITRFAFVHQGKTQDFHFERAWERLLPEARRYFTPFRQNLDIQEAAHAVLRLRGHHLPPALGPLQGLMQEILIFPALWAMLRQRRAVKAWRSELRDQNVLLNAYIQGWNEITSYADLFERLGLIHSQRLPPQALHKAA